MLPKLSTRLDAVARHTVPEPFTVAALSTGLTVALALIHVNFDVRAVMTAWVSGAGSDYGLWNLMAFGMQICLLLVTTHALVKSPHGSRLLDGCARRCSDPGRTVLWVAAVSVASGYIHWALPLVGGALLVRRIGDHARASNTPIHYPLLAMAGFSGLSVWHGGIAGSVPYRVSTAASQAHVLGEQLAEQVGAISRSQTIGAPSNLLLSVALLIFIPWLLARLMPGESKSREPAPESVAKDPNSVIPANAGIQEDALDPPLLDPRVRGDDVLGPTIAERLDRSRVVLGGLLVLALLAYGMVIFRQGIVLNVFNFLALFGGLAAHGSIEAYMRCIKRSAPTYIGVALIFPLYAGMMGIFAGCDLGSVVAPLLGSTHASLLPAVAFYSAGFFNMFLPSGGGQWVVQGAAFLESAIEAGVSPTRMVMAFAYGEQWTNVISPFWALPMLAITGVRFGSIVGYGLVLLLGTQVLFLTALYL